MDTKGHRFISIATYSGQDEAQAIDVYPLRDIQWKWNLWM